LAPSATVALGVSLSTLAEGALDGSSEECGIGAFPRKGDMISGDGTTTRGVSRRQPRKIEVGAGDARQSP
jgi:hypothetical protein